MELAGLETATSWVRFRSSCQHLTPSSVAHAWRVSRPTCSSGFATLRGRYLTKT